MLLLVLLHVDTGSVSILLVERIVLVLLCVEGASVVMLHGGAFSVVTCRNS